MPDKPFTVISYAASASLAAIALIYFFNPNQLLDGDSSTSSASTRKKGIVGLSNPANDCFINSILQSLAGLGELRLYLIRELHRRELDGPTIYAAVPEDTNGKPIDIRKLASLQSGEVTKGLKCMIDNLNERPIYKKTISAGSFIRVLEHAFGTRISKSQQDAQELLQIVAERLGEEYYARKEARKRAINGGMDKINVHIPRDSIESGPSQSTNAPTSLDVPIENQLPDEENGFPQESTTNAPSLDVPDHLPDEENGFPLEGQTEAQTECLHCHFMPKANPTSFVMLNLMVPQKSSTTLNECFDAHFKLEYIDDYKCDKCRLNHALESFTTDLDRVKSPLHKTSIQTGIDAIQKAIQEDPEVPPPNIELPDIALAPKRRIARHVQITSFPKVLIIHLSRSIYDRSSSTKNTSKVSFPERLPLGSILNRRHYKLLGMVSHKGTHNSGHYESFRRQHVYAPISTPHVQKSGPYGNDSLPKKSLSPPHDMESPSPAQDPSTSTTPRTRSLSSISLSPSSTRPSSGSISGTSPIKPVPNPGAKSVSPFKDQQTSNPRRSKSIPSSSIDRFRPSRKKISHDRWWRISDDKVKECKTGDVLGMQKDVYMLFYEMDRDAGDSLYVGGNK